MKSCQNARTDSSLPLKQTGAHGVIALPQFLGRGSLAAGGNHLTIAFAPAFLSFSGSYATTG